MTTKGFTLMETLIAVMLTGTLTTLALAPTVRAISGTVDTMNSRRDHEALTRTISIIERDVMNAMRLSTNAITVTDHDSLGGFADDTLAVMTVSPSVQGHAGGTVVYKTLEGGVMQNNLIPGLYRWVIPGKRPNDVNTNRLDGDEAQLVLPDVMEFSVEVQAIKMGDEPLKSYSGALPKGLYIRVRRGKREGMSDALNRDKEDREDELSRTITLP
ncbi:MAG: hypothetical protein IJT02_01270 [Synergistaceae bacterium]|nr:hypothetical protein [Synergistaceae bacterium]